MSIQILHPARVNVNPQITSVALLNRSIPTQNSTDQFLTLELKNQDTKLSEECMRGMTEFLSTSSRFAVKRCETSLPAADPKSLSFGEQLNWDVVDSICQHYGTNGLLVLEYFDTDLGVTAAVSQTVGLAQSVMNGNTNPTVTGTATATAGFRFYDNVYHTIVYQDRFGWRDNFTESASDILFNGKPTQYNGAMLNTSYNTGKEFAAMIVPLYFWENRDIYKKGKSTLISEGYRLALTRGWEQAYQDFSQAYESATSSKTRARAAFNAALAQEVQGNLQSANDWIQKSYVAKPKQVALNYSNVLQRRLKEQQQLNWQENK